jgi:O-antigen/teichoic acid export membrane protein
MSIKKSILKNGIAAALQKVVKVLEQLFLVPFFIAFWGPAYYGEWLTLTIIPSFLALSEFGFGSATANTFLIKYASGDKQGAATVAKTGVRIMTYLIGASILLSILIVFILYKFDVFEKSLIPSSQAVFAVIILLISKIIGFYQQIFEAHFRAARRASLSINFTTLISIANIVGGLIILVCGGKVIGFAMVSLCISLVLYPIYIILAERVLGLHQEAKGIYDPALVKNLVHKGFGYFLAPIWQAIYYQGCTFVVRIVLGPIAVTIFNTVRTLIRSSSQAFAMLITATYPDFQFELNAGRKDKALKIFLGTLGGNIILALVFIIGIGVFGETLYNIWTHKALTVPTDIWIIFIVSVLFYALWFTFSFIFEALNKPYTYTLASLVCAVIAVSISWLLCLKMGLVGAAIGNLCFDVLMCIYLLPIGAKIFKMSVVQIIRQSLLSVKQIVYSRFLVKTHL